MFGLKHIKLVKELTNIKPQLGWLRFSDSRSSKKSRDAFINEIILDNKFVREDIKIRAMVEEMLQSEFSGDIKNLKSYDFLVDSVVNRLKQKQLGNVSIEEDLQ